MLRNVYKEVQEIARYMQNYFNAFNERWNFIQRITL